MQLKQSDQQPNQINQQFEQINYRDLESSIQNHLLKNQKLLDNASVAGKQAVNNTNNYLEVTNEVLENKNGKDLKNSEKIILQEEQNFQNDLKSKQQSHLEFNKILDTEKEIEEYWDFFFQQNSQSNGQISDIKYLRSLNKSSDSLKQSSVKIQFNQINTSAKKISKQKRDQTNDFKLKQLYRKLQQKNFFIMTFNPNAQKSYIHPLAAPQASTKSLFDYLSITLLYHTTNGQILHFFIRYGQYGKKYIVLNQGNKSFMHSCDIIGEGNMGRAYLIPKYCDKLFKNNVFFPKNHQKQHSFCKHKQKSYENKSIIKCIEFDQSRFEGYFRNFLVQYFVADMMSAIQIGPKIHGHKQNIKQCQFDSYQAQFDFVIYQGCFQFEMELCDQPAKMRIDDQKLLKQYKIQLKQSLLSMHLLSIVHNDIKPQNILYSQTFRKLVFIDFGISQHLSVPIGYKKLTSFLGTYSYAGYKMKRLFENRTKDWINLYKNDTEMLSLTFKEIFKYFDRIQIQRSDEQVIDLSVHLNLIVSHFKYLIFVLNKNYNMLVRQTFPLIDNLKNTKLYLPSNYASIDNAFEDLISFCTNQVQSSFAMKNIVNQLKNIKFLKQFDFQGEKYFQRNNYLLLQNQFSLNKQKLINKSRKQCNAQNFQDYLRLSKDLNSSYCQKQASDQKQSISENAQYNLSEFVNELTMEMEKEKNKQTTVAHETKQQILLKTFKKLIKLGTSRNILQKRYHLTSAQLTFQQLSNHKQQFSSNIRPLLLNINEIISIQDINQYFGLVYQHISFFKNFWKHNTNFKTQISKTLFYYNQLFLSGKIKNHCNEKLIQNALKTIKMSQLKILVLFPQETNILNYPQLLNLFQFLLVYCFQFPNSTFAQESAFNILKDCILLGFQYMGFIRYYLARAFKCLLLRKKDFFITLAIIETIEISQIIKQKWLITSQMHRFTYKNDIFNSKYYDFLKDQYQKDSFEDSQILEKIELFKKLWIFYRQYQLSTNRKQTGIVKIFSNLIKQIQKQFKHFPQYILLSQKAIKYCLLISKICCSSLKRRDLISSHLVQNHDNIYSLNENLDAFDLLVLRASNLFPKYNSLKNFDVIDYKINFQSISYFLLMDCRFILAIQCNDYNLVKILMKIITQNIDFNVTLSTCLFNFELLTEILINYLQNFKEYSQPWQERCHLQLLKIIFHFVNLFSKEKYEIQIYIVLINLLIQITIRQKKYARFCQKKYGIQNIESLIIQNVKHQISQLQKHRSQNLHFFSINQSQIQRNEIKNKYYMILFSNLLILRYLEPSNSRYFKYMKYFVSQYLALYNQLSYETNLFPKQSIKNQNQQYFYSYSLMHHRFELNLLSGIMTQLSSNSLTNKYFQIKKQFLIQKKFYNNQQRNYITSMEYDIFTDCFLEQGQFNKLLSLMLLFLSQEQNFFIDNKAQYSCINKVIRKVCDTKQIDQFIFCNTFYQSLYENNFIFCYKNFMILANLLLIKKYFEEDLLKWKRLIIKLLRSLKYYKQNLTLKIFQIYKEHLIYQCLELHKRLQNSKYQIKAFNIKSFNQKTKKLIKKYMYRLLKLSQSIGYNKRINYVKQFLQLQKINCSNNIFNRKVFQKRCNILTNVLNQNKYLKLFQLNKNSQEKAIIQLISQDLLQQQQNIEQKVIEQENLSLQSVFYVIQNNSFLKRQTLNSLMNNLKIKNVSNIQNKDIYKFYSIFRGKNNSNKQFKKQQYFDLKYQISKRQNYQEKQKIIEDMEQLLTTILIVLKQQG